MATYKETLCGLTIGQASLTARALAGHEANLGASGLDARTHALVQVAALIAMDAEPALYMSPIEEATRAGAPAHEIVGCLLAVLPTVGVARAASVAPKLGLALGYDVEAALEDLDPPQG